LKDVFRPQGVGKYCESDNALETVQDRDVTTDY